MKIAIKVKPGSKEQKISKQTDMFGNELYEIKLKSLPKDGEANKELIDLLAKEFKTAKSNIQIKSGLSSRSKVVFIKSNPE